MFEKDTKIHSDTHWPQSIRRKKKYTQKASRRSFNAEKEKKNIFNIWFEEKKETGSFRKKEWGGVKDFDEEI